MQELVGAMACSGERKDLLDSVSLFMRGAREHLRLVPCRKEAAVTCRD